MVKVFLTDRLRTLTPTRDVASPFALLAQLSTRQWLYLLLGFLGWTWDAFDFYSISTVLPVLTTYFGKSEDAMALGLTISLIPRFLGAAIFGMASDRYGRKWPFVINCLLLSILELCLAFCKTYTPFIIIRALFGIAMGGMYGNATTTALEDCPKAARGLVGGIYQSGYPMGFLLATALWRAFDSGHQEADWKHIFYFAACPPILLIVLRVWIPETEFFEHRIRPANSSQNTLGFMIAVREAMKRHWQRILYLVAFMFGCTFLSHGSEDVFPLMLGSQYGYSTNQITATQATAYIGSVIGSLIIGFGSQIVGRRFSIIVACSLGACLIYPYCFVSGPGLYPIVFLEQFAVQGVFGIVPIHLIELSPPAFRTFVVGTSYNLGLLLASWVPLVETSIGERRQDADGHPSGGYQYSMVMAAILSCGFVYTIIVTFLGPENREGSQGAENAEENSDGDRVSVHFMVQEVC